MRINQSFLINGLREIGSSLIKQIKHTSSVLAHIGCVSNSGADYHQTPKSFYPRAHSQNLTQNIPLNTRQTEKFLIPPSTTKLAEKIEPIKDSLQFRQVMTPEKIDNGITPAKKRRAPLPPLTPTMIIQLEQIIEKDRQSTDWYDRYNSPRAVLKPTRRAPLPPLSEAMIEKLVQMIENDKKPAKNTHIAD